METQPQPKRRRKEKLSDDWIELTPSMEAMLNHVARVSIKNRQSIAILTKKKKRWLCFHRIEAAG